MRFSPPSRQFIPLRSRYSLHTADCDGQQHLRVHKRS
jgi:hypothetical protein